MGRLRKATVACAIALATEHESKPAGVPGVEKDKVDHLCKGDPHFFLVFRQ